MERGNSYRLLVVKTSVCSKNNLIQYNKPFPSMNINTVEQALLLGKCFTKVMKTMKCLESPQIMFLKAFK